MDNQNDAAFRDFFRFLRRGAPYALVLALLCGAAVFLYARRLPANYEATTTLLASPPSSGASSGFGVSLITSPPTEAETYRAVARSSDLLRRALEIVEPGVAVTRARVQGLNERLELRVGGSRSDILLDITVTSRDPRAAAARADAVGDALVAWDDVRAQGDLTQVLEALRGQIAAIDAQLAALDPSAERVRYDSLIAVRADQLTRLNMAEALRSSVVGRLQVIERAAVPLRPAGPRVGIYTALAVVLGFALAYALLLLRDATDTRVRGSEDMTRLSGLPVLAEFPRQPPGERRLPRESSSYLRTGLLFATPDLHPKVFLVTSASSEQGKSSVALSLAESFARDGHRTLLVDADLRRPVLGAEYELDPKRVRSLQQHLEAHGTPLATATIQLDNAHEFDLVPGFTAAADPAELIGRGFRMVLERWRAAYDVIVIDSAPLLPVADTLILAPHCSGVVFAARPGGADRRGVRRAVELLERFGVRVFGVAVTSLAASAQSEQGYGYGYGYSAGAGSAPAPAAPKEKKTKKTIFG